MKKILALTITLLIFIPSIAFALSVNPLKIDLSSEKPTDTLTVRNDTPKKCKVQISLFKWSQDQEGKDIYEPTKDIIFYPHLLIMEPQESRMIRIGHKTKGGGVELTYRLYVEELPEFGQGKRIPILDEEGEERKNFQVYFLTRYGIPIFIKPKSINLKGGVEKVLIAKENLEILVSNKGNTNFSLESIKVAFSDGKKREKLHHKVDGWRLLPGAQRWYKIALPQGVSPNNFMDMEVEIETNKFTFQEKVDKYFIKEP